jgi:hypothetical protein
MKKIIYIVAGLLLVMQTFTSCEKSFLDEKNYSSYAPETLTDSLGFEASAVGLYTQMSYFFSKSDAQGWPCVWQVGTDVAYSTPNQQGIEIPYYDLTQLTSTDGAAYSTWQWAYQMINNTNNIIKSIESKSLSGMTQNNKNQIDGEARFFRAYAYNILATLFGKVPVITEPLTKPKTDFVRAPIDSVNKMIEKDLLFAATYLPTIDNVKKTNGKSLYARVNQACAQQLLAEAYLRMGRPADAETQCVNIIKSGKFSLNTARFGTKASQPGDPFSDMFISGNIRRSQGNMEAIWVMEQENTSSVVGGYTGAPQQRRCWGAAYYQISGLSVCDSLGGRGIARMRLNNWVLYKLYEPTDMRNSQYNIRRRYTYNDPSKTSLYGKLVPYSGADTIYKICPCTTKWYQFDPNDVFGWAMIKDFTLMRYGETYLLLAEAQYKQGHLDDAMNSINVIRNRAHATPLTNSAQVTMDFILDERARELIGEENRRMTLMRTGMLFKRALRLNNDTNCPHPINGMDSTTTNKFLMPIPQSEIDLNKDAVLEQNPGY